ncbi:MAG: DNA polymerase III subunit delta [Bacteroidales bacterium]|nr:DNA polymerase III subunit delta [Bacteroidales bacterium]
MTQDYKQLIDNIKAGIFAPVYLITGEENYYIDIVQDYFENNIVDESLRDFDQCVVYGRETVMEDVIATAKQFPMMSQHKLVMVKEAQDIETQSHPWEQVADYLEHPHNQTILVFCYRNKKLDKRTRAYKAIDKVGIIVETKQIKDDNLTNWIGTYVNQQGYRISPQGATLIAEFTGNNLSKLANELNKVFINIPAGSDITEDVIERNIGISKEYNSFELQKAIGNRDVVRCNKIINYFAANPKGNSIIPLLGLLYGYFIKIMILHQTPNPADAAKMIGVHPYYLKDYQAAARNYSLGKLASCIGYLHEADLRVKGITAVGTFTEGEILKELIFKIIH